jgi:hypothetical protein
MWPTNSTKGRPTASRRAVASDSGTGRNDAPAARGVTCTGPVNHGKASRTVPATHADGQTTAFDRCNWRATIPGNRARRPASTSKPGSSGIRSWTVDTTRAWSAKIFCGPR